MRIPTATYRLQLNRDFPLSKALGLVEYLHELGAGACYLSPLLEATPGSNHGYDVVNHARVNPELGTELEVIGFAKALAQRDMGVILDVVPNHMCVAGPANRWWRDVLENGPSSPFARFFDIDWQPPKADLRAKVLLPILGDQFGCVLEDRAISIAYEDDTFVARYYDTRLPIAPRTWHHILEPALETLRADRKGTIPPINASLDWEHVDASILELESILTALRHLPLRTDTEEARVRERLREKEIVKRRLKALMSASPSVREAIDDAVRTINGEAGNPATVDHLEELLEDQGYRPAFWRVACDEINYRRFFDINELAAIRVEEPAVFRAVHEIPLRLARQGLITGLRIDHVDGLLMPAQYLEALQHTFGPLLKGPSDDAYVVVEKILGPGEHLPATWPVAGTTGYDFTALVTGVLVDPRGLATLRQIYEEATGRTESFDDVVYESKQLVLRTAMSAELTVLARRLDAISEQHRTTRDFTLNSLHEALSEVIACFPVYRTYVGPDEREVNEADRRQIEIAIARAKRRNPAMSGSLFDFIRTLLLLEEPPGTDASEAALRRDFVLRFQQLTGPVTAKGLEDTSYYRHFPLAALNEVGGGHRAVSVEAFHQANLERRARSPHTMNATATHDTKRGEDVRARLVGLAELPNVWRDLLASARRENDAFKTEVGGTRAPDANEEYLLYQTVLGVWPMDRDRREALPELISRVQAYMQKAIREAKVNTSWIRPDEAYEEAVRSFVAKVLDPAQNPRFLAELAEVQAKIAHAGVWASLTQVLLKIASPGVPDFYQGSELWDLTLVDPDNRRPVDFEGRREVLRKVRLESEADTSAFLDSATQSFEDGRLKMFVTHRALTFRRAHRGVFEDGTYTPLNAHGARAEHVIAFSREAGGETAVALTGRLFHGLGREAPTGPRWDKTYVDAPRANRYRHVLTGDVIEVEKDGDRRVLSLPRVFAKLPLALLWAIE